MWGCPVYGHVLEDFLQPFLRKVWQRKSIQRDGGKSVKGNTSIGGLEEQGTIPNACYPK